MNEKTFLDSFPDSLLSHVPIDGKGMDRNLNLRSYIEFDSSLKKYVDIDNSDGAISINHFGKRYFEHLENQKSKETEIVNKPLLQFFDNSINVTGNGNTSNIGDGNVSDSENVTAIQKSNLETVKIKQEKKPQQKRASLERAYWIAGILLALIALFEYLSKYLYLK